MDWSLSDYWLPPVSCTDMLTGLFMLLQIQVALAVLVQAISLAGAFELQVLLERGNAGDFMDSVSLRLVFGILCWIILLQWYRMNRTDESDFEEISGTEADKGQEEAVPAGETFLDLRIGKRRFPHSYHPSRGTVISASRRRLCDDFYSGWPVCEGADDEIF